MSHGVHVRPQVASDAALGPDGGHAHEVTTTVVLHTGGLNYASEKAVLEKALGSRPGVLSVDANPVAQTAAVRYDPKRTSVAELSKWVEECGYHCAGQSVPGHICSPMEEAPSASMPGDHAAHSGPAMAATAAPAAHAGHDMVMAPEEAMGHGGAAGMSMASMVRDMRNRFILAAALSVPILLWSQIGRKVLGFEAPAPLGLRDDVFQLILSVPVIFYSAWIFFDGAVRALRDRKSVV